MVIADYQVITRTTASRFNERYGSGATVGIDAEGKAKIPVIGGKIENMARRLYRGGAVERC